MVNSFDIMKNKNTVIFLFNFVACFRVDRMFVCLADASFVSAPDKVSNIRNHAEKVRKMLKNTFKFLDENNFPHSDDTIDDVDGISFMYKVIIVCDSLSLLNNKS